MGDSAATNMIQVTQVLEAPRLVTWVKEIKLPVLDPKEITMANGRVVRLSGAETANDGNWTEPKWQNYSTTSHPSGTMIVKSGNRIHQENHDGSANLIICGPDMYL